MAALFLLAVVSGCSGDDSDSGVGEEAETTVVEMSDEGAEAGGEESDQGAATKPGAKKKADGASGGEAEQSQGSGKDGSGTSVPDEFEVPPNRHKDSGGGSKQYRVPGADNSIQDSGSEADRDTFAEVAAIVHAFLDSRAANNGEESCRYLSSSITEHLMELAEQLPDNPSSCGAVVDAMTISVSGKEARRMAKADIGSVRIDGDSGFVLYRGAGNIIHVLPIVYENNRWRVSALGGSVMPDQPNSGQ